MTPEPITITPGLRQYPPLLFTWQKWPMKIDKIECFGATVRVAIIVYFQRNNTFQASRWERDFDSKKVKKILFDERGPTNKSMERFYQMAHTWLDMLARFDPSIQAFAPEVGQE